MKQKVTVFGSFVVDLMARTPHLPAPAETVKGSFFKQGAGGKGFNQGVAAHKAGGAITGTFVGTLLMVVIKNAGKAFQINDYILDVITGALIIFAVAMDMVKSRKKA